MSYEVRKIFDDRAIAALNRCWELNEHRRRNQDQYYNLFFTDHRYPSTEDKVYNHYLRILEEAATDDLGEWHCDKHYLLEYKPGAYARLHHDDPVVGKTSVTLLSDNGGELRGGYTLIEVKGKDRMLDVVDLKVGETVTYEHDVHHAVSVVHEGFRRVHIGWMKPNNPPKKKK